MGQFGKGLSKDRPEMLLERRMRQEGGKISMRRLLVGFVALRKRASVRRNFWRRRPFFKGGTYGEGREKMRSTGPRL